MAEAFNLNNFLSEQATYNLRQYTAVENGKAAMEAREIEMAQKAVQPEGLLSLTLGAKLPLRIWSSFTPKCCFVSVID